MRLHAMSRVSHWYSSLSHELFSHCIVRRELSERRQSHTVKVSLCDGDELTVTSLAGKSGKWMTGTCCIDIKQLQVRYSLCGLTCCIADSCIDVLRDSNTRD